MFDPTVFDNLKVAFENQLYDLDTLDRKIDIINRIDRMEMAVMSREFALQFRLAGRSAVSAEVQLSSSLKDLAAEILEWKGETPSCSLRLRFVMKLHQIDEQCEQIEQIMMRIWEPDAPPTQTISYVYGAPNSMYTNVIELAFSRKINEEQMDDIEGLVNHMLQTLTKLEELSKSE
nr:hypothetical protein [Paenibacillus sinopodophylli]